MSQSGPLVSTPLGVLAVLLFVLAGLFALKRIPSVARLFEVVPIVVFCYFVPTLLSNTGVIPLESELRFPCARSRGCTARNLRRCGSAPAQSTSAHSGEAAKAAWMRPT